MSKEELNKKESKEALNSEEKVKHYYNLGNGASFGIPNGKGGVISFTRGTLVTDDEYSKKVIEGWVKGTNHEGATKELYDEANLEHNPARSQRHFGAMQDGTVITDIMGSQSLAKPMGATTDASNVASLQGIAEAGLSAKSVLEKAQNALAAKQAADKA